MTTTKTIAGRIPFIELSTLSGRPAGAVWISDNHGSALNKSKGTWDKNYYEFSDDNYWPNREAAQAYIDEHADKPSGLAEQLAEWGAWAGKDDLTSAITLTDQEIDVLRGLAARVFQFQQADGPPKAPLAMTRDGLELPNEPGMWRQADDWWRVGETMSIKVWPEFMGWVVPINELPRGNWRKTTAEGEGV